MQDHSAEIQSLKQQARTLLARNELKSARSLYNRICALNQADAESWFVLGAIQGVLGHLDEAIACCRRVLALQPTHVDALYNLAQAYMSQHKHHEAIESYREVVRLHPQHALALNNLGYALQQIKEYGQSIDCYRRALQLMPHNAGIWNSLGSACLCLEKWDEAEAAYRNAIASDPVFAEAYYYLGIAQDAQNKLEEAEQNYRHALRCRTDYAGAHWNLSHILLLSGRFEEGWNEYEWRWRCKEHPPRSLGRPRWDGSSLARRTLLVYPEQGYGDAIQFIRYVSVLKKQGATVLVECHQPLASLFSTCVGIDRLIVRGETLPDFDFHIPLLSLPAMFRTTLRTIPANVPYLRVPEGDYSRLRTAVNAAKARLKVGMVWAGNPDHNNDRNRSCALEHFFTLSRIPGIALVSLQKGNNVADLKGHEEQAIDLSPFIADFSDTAYSISQLDLVITVDTSVAHLAGALGKPVWVLLPLVPDWRWLLGRNDSPWYPTMRLFRQRRMGDWKGVFEEVTAALNVLLNADEIRMHV